MIPVLALLGIWFLAGGKQGEDLLPLAQQIIASEVEIEQYGAFYLDRENGLKFVVALAKQDEKTDRMIERLKRELPADLLMVRDDYRYTIAELKQVNADLGARVLELRRGGNEIACSYVDDASDKVIIEARVMTDETKAGLRRQYGAEKIEIRVNPAFTEATPIQEKRLP